MYPLFRLHRIVRGGMYQSHGGCGRILASEQTMDWTKRFTSSRSNFQGRRQINLMHRGPLFPLAFQGRVFDEVRWMNPIGCMVASPSNITLRRSYNSGPHRPWSLVSKAKTVGLVTLGVGAVCFTTAAMIPLVLGGACAFGLYRIYTGYQEFVMARRSTSQRPSDLKVDHFLSDLFHHPATRGKSPWPIVGMPIMVQGLIYGVFKLVGPLLQASAGRVSDIQRTTRNKLLLNARVRGTLGTDIDIDMPKNLYESSINGVGTIVATFNLSGSKKVPAEMRVEARVRGGRALEYSRMEVYVLSTGEIIDLLKDPGSSGKIILDAEYTDINDFHRK